MQTRVSIGSGRHLDEVTILAASELNPTKSVDVVLDGDGLPERGPDAPVPSATPVQSVTLATVRQLADASRDVVQRVRDVSLSAEGPEGLDSPERTSRGYKITEVAAMIGKTTEAIRRAEREGRLQRPPMGDNNRRLPYPLSLVNEMRRYWDISPGRGPVDDVVRIAIQNFKGGVAKTVLSVHCAQFFARLGYRVLVIDCDSQASATAMFGFNPDEDIEAATTLLPLFQGEQTTLHYAIRPTHWDQLDLVAANLDLADVEFSSTSSLADDWMEQLDRGIATVEDAYDIVLIDPPPSLGLVSLNVLRAADGLIVPAPPAMVDFHSTASFFSMLHDVVEKVGRELGEPVELDFLKVVISKLAPGRMAHQLISGFMAASFGRHVLRNPLLASSEIENAAAQWQTVYDLEAPTGSRETYRRCVESLDALFGEIERLVQAVWEARRAERVLGTDQRPHARDDTAAPAKVGDPVAAGRE